MLVSDVFAAIHRDVESDDIRLPSLPDIAMRVHRTAADPNCTFDTIGRVLKSDPALSAHLIRMANSPLYKSRVPVTNVRAAVHRIGVPGVRSFATGHALSNLFHSYNAGLNRLFLEVWEDCCGLSALTAVLANFCAGFDPDDALLAGLIQDVGVIVLLGQLALRGEDLTDTEELGKHLDEQSPAIGRRLLESWQFDDRYIEVVASRHAWLREHDSRADLTDLVTLARLHHYAVTGRQDSAPPADAVPAFAKLPVGGLGPNGGLQILHEAQAEVAEIRSMLRR